jgi:hypothetical protein
MYHRIYGIDTSRPALNQWVQGSPVPATQMQAQSQIDHEGIPSTEEVFEFITQTKTRTKKLGSGLGDGLKARVENLLVFRNLL